MADAAFVLRAAARALRAHAHADGERWARQLDELAERRSLPRVVTPEMLDLLGGLAELAKVPVISADAAQANFGESVGELGALLALRNVLLDASVLLLDGLAAGQPVERLN